MTISEILKAKGLGEDVIKEIMDEMKANKIFTASEENLDIRYGKTKTELESVTKERDEGKALIAELQKSNKGNEDLQKQVAEYEAKMAQLQAKLVETQIDADAQAQLLAGGVKPDDLDYVMFKLKAKGPLEMGEDGHVKGMDDKIAAMKTQLPANFNGESKKKYEEFKLPENEGNRETEPKNLADALRMQYEQKN